VDPITYHSWSPHNEICVYLSKGTDGLAAQEDANPYGFLCQTAMVIKILIKTALTKTVVVRFLSIIHALLV